jgi:hypothetical protein
MYPPGLQLQQELHKCEGVIDAVVDAHHLGFNHAIENYSKILSLFNECKAQVRHHAAARLATNESQTPVNPIWALGCVPKQELLASHDTLVACNRRAAIAYRNLNR